MKTIRFSPGTIAVLTTFLLSAATLKAQTFNGKPTLAESPSTFEAVVFPLSNAPTTLRVIFNNFTGGAVRVVVRNREGAVFYENYETVQKYRRRFDLSQLPQGTYMVELSKQKESFLQAFAINPPVEPQSQIALLAPSPQKTPAQPAEKKLAVRQ